MKSPWVLTLVVMIGLSAAAQGGTKENAARAEYQKGTAAYNLGRFDEAAQHYEAAYKLVPDPNMLFNIAQSYRMAGKLEQALPVFRGFLRESPPHAPNRSLAERLVEDIKRKIEEKKATPSPSVPQADAQSPVPAPLPPYASTPGASQPPTGWGDSVPAPSAPGATPPVASPVYARPPEPPSPPSVGYAPGSVAPPPVPAPVASSQVAPQGPGPASSVMQVPSRPESANSGRGLRIAGVVCGAAAVAFVAAGAVFSVQTRSYSNKAETSAEWNPSHADTGNMYEQLQWVSYGVGSGLAITGVVFYWLGAASGPGSHSSVVALPVSGGAVLAAKGVF